MKTNPFLTTENIFDKLNNGSKPRSSAPIAALNHPPNRDVSPIPPAKFSFGKPEQPVSQNNNNNNTNGLVKIPQFQVQKVSPQVLIPTNLAPGRDNYLLKNTNPSVPGPLNHNRPKTVSQDLFPQIVSESSTSISPIVLKPNPFQRTVPVFQKAKAPVSTDSNSNFCLNPNPFSGNNKTICSKPIIPDDAPFVSNNNQAHLAKISHKKLRDLDQQIKVDKSDFGSLNPTPRESEHKQQLFFVPLSPLHQKRQEDAQDPNNTADYFDLNLLDNYISKCLASEANREQLCRLVGLQGNLFSSDVTETFQSNLTPRNNQIVVPKKTVTQYYASGFVADPAFSTRQGKETNKIPSHSNQQYLEMLAEMDRNSMNFQNSKILIKDEILVDNSRDYFLPKVESYCPDTMPGMKPLKQGMAPESYGLQSSKKEAEKPKRVRLSLKINLDQRISKGIKQGCEKNSTRVFLTMNQKFTMNRVHLSQ